MITLFSTLEETRQAVTLKEFSFSSFADIQKELSKIKEDSYSFEEFKNFRDYVLNNEAMILPIIGRLTIAEIKKVVYIHRNYKKAELVSQVYDAIVSSFNLDISGAMVSYSPFEGQTYKGELLKKYALHTPEMLEAYREDKKAKKAAFLKAMNNPENSEEFRLFISRKGESALTQEQRAAHDNLTADGRKERKEREEASKSKITAVEVGDVEMTLHETIHTKKNIHLWVVKLSDRVDRDKYTELNNKCKKIGGYYSSYRGNGAIAGFTFESKEEADLFMELKNGNVDSSEVKEQQKEEKTQTRAEILKEKAAKVIEEGEEELNRPRQANTSRRAGFAASAENKAINLISFGKTLLKIAEGIENGTIKYLSNISNFKDLEELENALYRAKCNDMKVNKIRSEDYRLTTTAADFAALPYPLIYKTNAGELQRAAESAGKKLAAARLLKSLARVRGEFLEVGKYDLQDFYKVFCQPCSVIDSWRVTSNKERVMQIKRLNRIGIDTIEELRAALRELIVLKQGATITPEQAKAQEIKELERTFLNKKIGGFFPTPSALAHSLIELADIREGDVILEPSAGLGHIADIISKLHPDNKLICFEQYTPLHDALILKGHNSFNVDFLNMAGAEPNLVPDKIIMNPPFENLQDIDHVQHAFKLLKRGGRLVAIMAANKERSSRSKVNDFMDFVNDNGYFINNPANSFASAFRPTGVSTITVILDK
jgi:phospholipid N-methyltransferase